MYIARLSASNWAVSSVTDVVLAAGDEAAAAAAAAAAAVVIYPASLTSVVSKSLKN